MYKTALDSMECYALQNNYSFLLLSGGDFEAVCEHKDITFQRHCIVFLVLKSYNFTWVHYVDSDIGVVNEKIVIIDNQWWPISKWPGRVAGLEPRPRQLTNGTSIHLTKPEQAAKVFFC
ncbi:unnamed protein product [Cylicocyclus nassatus]|uniref:Uncharacterized protein n=1 Tax=Cylicocyclus nassatus TaxID=53992 RepID=A0AA36H716_CYLNA|nr:unnamed protein product [Cylicocyclus nassatus]